MTKKLLVFIMLIIIFYDIYIFFIIDIENSIKDESQTNNELKYIQHRDYKINFDNDKYSGKIYKHNDYDTSDLQNISENKHYKLNEIHEIREKQLLIHDNNKISGSHDLIINNIPEKQSLHKKDMKQSEIPHQMERSLQIEKPRQIEKSRQMGSEERSKSDSHKLPIDMSPLTLRRSGASYRSDSSEIDQEISPMLYGKPSEYVEDNYILWEFNDPLPWTKIVYKYNENHPFYFFIKIKIPSLNDYQEWKNIIGNINFNPRSGEIIIPANDEETALAISNLMISHFKGDISMRDIINKNLIDISISKAKKYEIVKNKLIEQINNNIKIKNNFKDPITFQKDLAIEKMENIENIEKSPEVSSSNDYNAYEGTEYSFIQ